MSEMPEHAENTEFVISSAAATESGGLSEAEKIPASAPAAASAEFAPAASAAEAEASANLAATGAEAVSSVTGSSDPSDGLLRHWESNLAEVENWIGDDHPMEDVQFRTEDEQALRVRDRILLYVRGTELSPKESVELALEAMEKPESLDSCKSGMEKLRAVFHRHKLDHSLQGNDGERLFSAPPMNRRPMMAENLDRHPFFSGIGRGFRRLLQLCSRGECYPEDIDRTDAPAPDAQSRWERAGHLRRLLLLVLVIFPSLLAAQTMYALLPHKGSSMLEVGMVVLFAVLFGWISVGFWSATAGLMVMARRYDRFGATLNCPKELDIPAGVRTAILFPVYNEDVKRVMAGIRTIWHSLLATGQAEHFDIFILSDSTKPDSAVEEEEAWYRFCQEEDAFSHIYYRRRKNNVKRKSGNIADFCRRWGANYRYMIVYDADSIMSGTTMIRMTQTMEMHPEIGILQTPPSAVNQHSLIARIQQFSNRLYGPIFAAGMHFWQLGDAQYWGHNAIIRVEPFMRHCQLPSLPGKGPLGGEILSHDFVESALMRRAGFGVWLAYDLSGSYEESPPSLVDELIRDRRWCQGNLQHSRLIFAKGFFPTHRALFINGIMSYGSALLWLLFLLLSSLQAAVEILVPPSYFPSTTRTLFPIWPTWHVGWALTLLSSTAILLFLPKILASLLVLWRGEAKNFGGAARMFISMLGEVVVSTLLAPVRMLFHSIFVVTTLLGSKVSWNAQNRGEQGTSWGDALRFHWFGMMVGIVWGGLMWLINPGFFWWLSPIAVSLALSAPVSVWTSRVSLGQYARKLGLFLTPEEITPPEELKMLAENMRRPEPYSAYDLSRKQGFIRAVVIPRIHALHITLNSHRRPPSRERAKHLGELKLKALRVGPAGLSRSEQNEILNSPLGLHALHRAVWNLEDGAAAARWGVYRKEGED